MPAHEDGAAAIQTLREYYAASNKRDLQTMLSYYHEPVTFITARGVAIRATRADAAPLLVDFFERLRREGVARSDWADSHVKQLSDTLAVASVVVARYRADGQELERERVAWTYLLYRTGDGWKIGAGGSPCRHRTAGRLRGRGPAGPRGDRGPARAIRSRGCPTCFGDGLPEARSIPPGPSAARAARSRSEQAAARPRSSYSR
jgi:ketosteroid isomerase-like protein